MKKTTTEYSHKSIKHLDDLEHIKKRPAMYLGEMKDPFHMLKEALDNAIDEHMAGHVSNVHVQWFNGKEFFVADDGRGIPIEPHPKLKIPTITAVFTRLHTGGKFDRGDAYSTSVGTHGVGIKATCALAASLEVWTYRNKAWWYQAFKDGFPTKKKPEKVKGPPLKEGPFKKRGTQIRVVPNKKYFDTAKIDPELFRSRCYDVACLCPGLTISWQSGDKKPKVFTKKNGLADYVEGAFKAEAKDKGIEAMQDKPLVINGKLPGDEGEIGAAILWTTNDEETSSSFVNVSPTPEHGAHYEALVEAVTHVLKKYSKAKDKYDPAFLLTGSYLAVHAKLLNPHFKSQTKDKLLNKGDERTKIYDAIHPEIKKFFRKHKDMAIDLIEKAVQMTEARDSYQEKKRALKGVKVKSGAKGLLPGKLAEAPFCKPEKRELFIVEGDSAAGSIKNARDASFQEVLPLRGKIINAMKNDLGKVMDNEEIQAIVKSIGCGIDEDCDASKARVGKVMILTDADADGLHISALLLSFLSQHMAPLVEAGMVYVIDSPLFVGAVGEKRVFAHTQKKLIKKLKKMKMKKAHIERLKGHGQADPDEVREYAVNPETRRLYKMVLRHKKDWKLIKTIMGEDTATRKKIIGIAA